MALRGSTMIAGVDLSLTSTGVATITSTMTNVWTIPTKGKRADPLSDRGVRLRGIADQVLQLTAAADLVVIEGPGYGAPGGSTWDRAGLWWLVVSRLQRLDVPVVVVAPTTRAKYATGKGNADKAAVAVAVAKLFPALEINNSDEADSLALAHLGAVGRGLFTASEARTAIAVQHVSVVVPELKVS